MPLDVDSGIELPQLELTNNFTGDCTTAYSTGQSDDGIQTVNVIHLFRDQHNQSYSVIAFDTSENILKLETQLCLFDTKTNVASSKPELFI